MIVRMGYAGPEPLGQRIPCAIGADAVKNVAADVFLFQKIQHSRQIPFSIRHVFTYISYHIARKLRDNFCPDGLRVFVRCGPILYVFLTSGLVISTERSYNIL